MTNEPRTAPLWHAGERRLQAAHGVAERMAVVGPRVIRDFMPDQHRTFYSALPFLVLGSVDGEGRPWASLVEGPPGFVRSPDPRALEIDRALDPDDPASAGLASGAAVGLLGIELATRRRNRMNGRVTRLDEAGFAVAVEQAFGNCPQYIQRRELVPATAHAPNGASATSAEALSDLDDAARATLAAADTFFVASYVDGDGDGDEDGAGLPTDPSLGEARSGADAAIDRPHRAVDVSHRGGRPGFVRVEGNRLTIPDFAGNLHFNTLGNLIANPRAGLLFVDFDSGDLLQLSGRTGIVTDARAVASHPGAERLWWLEVERAVRRRSALGLRFALRDFSPKTLSTGPWSETPNRL
ncbi:MAG: pyridoxamine 5'-phosphate oxidase family protein [Deltaproteobacteria bacterium]|nr:pyridoxamine 5'-phosphate oxidase family protein [Deltaproteobacteria bacterium]